MNQSFEDTKKVMSTRRTLAVLATMMMAMLAVVLSGSPAQAGTNFHQYGVWGSSHCLDNDTGNDAKLQMWSCGTSSEKEWLLGFDGTSGHVSFTNQHTGRCITAPRFDPGTITMQTCDAADSSQQWLVYFADNPAGGPGQYVVWQNVSSGYCLTTPSVGNGTLIKANVCDPSDLYDRWSER